MTPNSVEAFDTTVQKTNAWVDAIALELGVSNRRHAYLALRGTLHALRDFLPLSESAQFSAQLPMLVRGLYFEGWNPAHTPEQDRTREAFLHRVEAAMERAMWSESYPIDTEEAARAVLRVLSEKVSAGEMDQVRGVLPKHLRELWPEPAGIDW